MSNPWDSEALWTKARLFINRAMEESRDFDEQAMWATLALEILGKAALARVNPVLIANPTEDGVNALAAAGLVEGATRFKSIQAKTVYSRCQRSFKPFDGTAATVMAESRNEYLHASTASFTDLPQDVWWGLFWAQAHILVEACEQDIHGFVGAARQVVVEEYLAKSQEHISKLLESRLERARRRLEQLSSGQLSVKETERLKRIKDFSARLKYSTDHECPACGSGGTLEGSDASDIDEQIINYNPVDYEVILTGTVETEYFSCNECGLVLDSLALIEAAKLPTDFEADVDAEDFWEPEYGND